MKTLKMITLGMLLFFASNSINAQISVNVNIGAQPSWGPVGYSSVDYYYIPDVQSYYDVRATQFIYLNNGAWIRSNRLPAQYRSYDLNRGYKVVLNDYHGSRPYDNYRSHKVKYYKGYKGKPQQSLGYRNNGNKNHGNYNNNGHHDNHGNSKGHGEKGHGGKKH
jgi:hypothetical protein